MGGESSGLAPLYFAAFRRPRPALRVSAFPDRPALLDFDFVDAAPPWRSGCAWLAGARREAWLADDGDGLAVRGLHRPVADDEDMAAAAEALYRELIAAVRPSAHPYLIRIWNYFGAINDGAGDAERYRRFCVGRDAAVDAMFRDPPPAATAIGAVDPAAPLVVVALCSARPAIALENPRQTPAWRYPREYGPVAPGFSRGAIVDGGGNPLLLASGTASIVGHVSQHHGDVLAQLDESLVNLQVLLDEGKRRSGADFAIDGLQALRVYLRDPSALAAAQARLEALGLPLARVAFLHGDVCRRELDVEIEGVFAAG
jgi:chorismate lyase/3-hydroxybenzoate synthase